MQEDMSSPLDLLKKNSTILDLLRHEVSIIISADRTLNRIDKTIMNSEVLKSLSFEQLMMYEDRRMRRQKEGRDFIIDFYRVTSKSPEVQSALSQSVLPNKQESLDSDGNVVSVESEQAIKQALLNKLRMLAKQQEEM